MPQKRTSDKTLLPHNQKESDENNDDTAFWRIKKLADMSHEEWESLCDGCAKCCLLKLEDIDTGDIAWTNVACRLLNVGSCRCSNYANRTQYVSDCVRLTPDKAHQLTWLPQSCAYRLLAEGKDLPSWHPLRSGSPNTVHQAGISVRNRVLSEDEIDEDDLEDHLVAWPNFFTP